MAAMAGGTSSYSPTSAYAGGAGARGVYTPEYLQSGYQQQQAALRKAGTATAAPPPLPPSVAAMGDIGGGMGTPVQMPQTLAPPPDTQPASNLNPNDPMSLAGIMAATGGPGETAAEGVTGLRPLGQRIGIQDGMQLAGRKVY